jgi:hypothetical protein
MLPDDSEEDLIAHIVEVAATNRQQRIISECTRQSALHHWLCIEVRGHKLEHLL